MPKFLTPKTLNLSLILLLNIIFPLSTITATCFLTYEGLTTLGAIIGFIYALPSLLKFDFQPRKDLK